MMRIVRYVSEKGDSQYAAEQLDGTYLRIEGTPCTALRVTSEKVSVGSLLAPVEPPMIWCIGQNYRKHTKEVGMEQPEFPVVFAKGVNTLQAPSQPIQLPQEAGSGEVDYEAELVVIIAKACRNVSREKALEYVAGYTCGNDVSARDWQLKKGGSQWCRGKSFDTFAPMGPCLVTVDELGDADGLRIQTALNGQIVQNSNTNDMIQGVPALVSFLSQSTTLMPGTAIFTGTPEGVGMGRKPPLWLKAGDEVSVTIEKIGTLTNRVSG